MIVYVATKNAGKVREITEIGAPLGWDVRTFDGYRDVVEDGTTYTENAALKARALSAQLREAGIAATVIGDDSGIEVRALNDRPGLFSARYGPPGATWAERRRSLLGELAASGFADRSARFVCAVVAFDGTRETVATASVAGVVPLAERGDGGFSYDAIFEIPNLGRTFAELTPEEKNTLSHRAIALRALDRKLREMNDAAVGRTE